MSLVLKKSGAVFLHPMKCGGTWVYTAMREAGIECAYQATQHANYESTLGLSPDGERFTVVRNPFAWYKSFWAFRDSKGWGGNLPIGHTCARKSFDHFILAAATQHPGYLTEYLAGFTVDTVYVMRNETLADDLCAFLREVGEDFDESRLRCTPRANRSACLPEYESVCWNTVTANLIVQSEPKLFLEWGYALLPDE